MASFADRLNRTASGLNPQPYHYIRRGSVLVFTGKLAVLITSDKVNKLIEAERECPVESQAILTLVATWACDSPLTEISGTSKASRKELWPQLGDGLGRGWRRRGLLGEGELAVTCTVTRDRFVGVQSTP